MCYNIEYVNVKILILWTFNEISIYSFQITVTKSSEGTVKSELTLSRVSWEDEGTYTCLAREITNDGGNGDTPTKQEILLEIYGRFTY